MQSTKTIIKTIYNRCYQFIEESKDKIYCLFFNYYNIEPCGYCPVQAEGTLLTGEFYYFRSRGRTWSVRIGKDETSIWDKNRSWYYSETKYEEFAGGWISKREAVKNFNKALEFYYNHNDLHSNNGSV